MSTTSRVLVTGGAGFVGQHIAQELLNDGKHTVLLTDVFDPPAPKGFEAATIRIKGDLCKDSASIVDRACNADGSPPNAVIILHGIMSSKSESDFDLGMAVNLDGTRALLNALRAKTAISKTAHLPRVIFASSLAVFGPPYPSTVSEATKPNPLTSYGAEKTICEFLVSEYSRRGFIDGITLRFPTVSIRPGPPAAAASAFLSGIIREPLNGIEVSVPIEDDSFESWLCSPATLTANLAIALKLPPQATAENRVVNLPGVVVSISDMLDALKKYGGGKALALVKREADPAVERILTSWPVRFDVTAADKLGFRRDESFDQMAKQYVDYIAAQARSS